MAGRSEYTLVGGTGVKIVPLEVSEAGTYTAGESEAYNPVTVTGGGSGKLAELVDGSITEVTAEDLAGATTIRSYAFNVCSSLVSVVIPESVTSIGANAFTSCRSLTSLTIPKGVTSIGSYAFFGCSGLTSLTVLPITPPSANNYLFTSVPATIPIYVPSASVDAYKAAPGWSDRAAYIQAIQP